MTPSSRIAAVAVIAVISATPGPVTLAQERRPALIAPPTLTLQRGLIAERATSDLSESQQARLADLAKSVDAGVLAGFRGREDLKARMENDLRDLAKMSDRSAKARAIAAFQARYSEDYRKVLVAGGVSMRDVAERLQGIFPGSLFLVENGTHVVEADPPPPPPAAKPPAATTTQTVTGSQMTQDPRFDGCGGAATGRIDTSRPSGQTNSAKVSNIGRCGGVGFMNYRFEAPQDVKARITGTVNLNTEASVVAVTGASYASARATVLHTNSSETAVVPGFFPVANSSVWVAAVWAASDSDPRPRQPIEGMDLRRSPGFVGINYLRARTSTSAWSLSLHGDADAWASVQEINATITLRPFSPNETP